MSPCFSRAWRALPHARGDVGGVALRKMVHLRGHVIEDPFHKLLAPHIVDSKNNHTNSTCPAVQLMLAELIAVHTCILLLEKKSCPHALHGPSCPRKPWQHKGALPPSKLPFAVYTCKMTARNLHLLSQNHASSAAITSPAVTPRSRSTKEKSGSIS